VRLGTPAPSSAKPKGATPVTEAGGGPHGKAGMADWIVDLIKALEAIPASTMGKRSDGHAVMDIWPLKQRMAPVQGLTGGQLPPRHETLMLVQK